MALRALFVLVSASPTRRDRSVTDSKAWPTVAPTVAPMTTWTPRFESRAMCYRQSVSRWSDSWGDWFARLLVWGTGALALAFALHSTPWTDPAGAVLAVVLVGAVTWAALPGRPVAAVHRGQRPRGLVFGRNSASGHKRPKHAPCVLAELDHIDPALHVHVNRPQCRSQPATPNPSSALSDLRKTALSGAQGGGLMW